MNKSKTLLCSSIALLLIVSINTWAALSGEVAGLVKDVSGAVISNATVTITAADFAVRRTLVTDRNGQFLATLLPIGVYEVRVESAGFRPTVERTLVKTGESVSLNITLEIGNIQQEIRLTEPVTPLITANDPQLTMSIEEKRVKELPLSYRDALVLATLSPGVIPVKAGNAFLGYGSFNSNGGRGRANNITIDNIISTDVSVTGAAGFGALNVDAIQEFKLITNNFNAEFGRNASAQVQIVTKRGTDQFHGTAYEFLRNDVFNSRDYFNKSGKASIQRWNQFGVTAGGPVYTDRLFYFGSYEGTQIRGLGGTRNAVVPTAVQRTAVTDPTSAAILSEVNLPVAEFDDPSGAFGNIAQSAPTETRSNAFSGRFDHTPGGAGRDLFTGRYAFQRNLANSPGLTFFQSNLAGFGTSSKNKPQQLSLGWTRVVRSTIINEGRFSFGRTTPQFAPQFTKSTPLVFVVGFDIFGESNSFPQGRTQNTFQYSDTLTTIWGRHSFKFGGDVHRIQLNSVADSNVRGTLIFSSWNDFAAGRLSSYQQRFGSSARGFRVTNVFGFAQDDFRIRPDLTLNLGFRLEIAGGIREVNNIMSNLDVTRPGAVGGAGPGPLGSFVLGGTVFRRNYNPEPRLGFAWNPNRGKWVVRGGYGIAHDFIFMNPVTNIRFLPPFIQTVSLQQTDAFTGGNTLANLVAGNAPVQMDGRGAVGSFNSSQVNFGSFNPIDTDLDNPQVQQWSLTIERQILPSLAARVGYVGTAGHHLLRSRQINPIPAGTILPASTEADEIARLAEFAGVNQRSFGGFASGSNRLDPRFDAIGLIESGSNSNYHSLQALVTKRFSSGYQFDAAYTWSKSIDDVSDVLGVLVNDSSAFQNPSDIRSNRAVSQFDIPHRLVINHIWEFPFFPNARGPVGVLVNGWAFNGIFDMQSGFPASVFSGARYGISDPSMTGLGRVRPNVLGDLASLVFAPAGSPEARNIPTPAQRGINTTASQRNTNAVGYPLVQPLLGTFGNLGRNTVRLNGFTNFDWVVMKTTRVTEQLSTQFRAELYNVFNNTSFAGFVNDLSSPAFGTYNNTDTTPRQMQFALKLIW